MTMTISPRIIITTRVIRTRVVRLALLLRGRRWFSFRRNIFKSNADRNGFTLDSAVNRLNYKPVDYREFNIRINYAV